MLQNQYPHYANKVDWTPLLISLSNYWVKVLYPYDISTFDLKRIKNDTLERYKIRKRMVYLSVEA